MAEWRHPGYASTMKIAAAALACLFAVLPADAQVVLPPIPDNGQPLRIDEIADIPAALRDAIERSYCKTGAAMLAVFPILIFRPAEGFAPMAVVPCEDLSLYSRAFLLPGAERMKFPVMAFAGRFDETEMPGYMSWDPRAKTLVALLGNEECGGTQTRHTYRHVGAAGAALNGFALAKVERGERGCGRDRLDTWQVIWEAGK